MRALRFTSVGREVLQLADVPSAGTVVVVADGWVQPSRQTVPDHRTCDRCGTTYARREMGVGWVATVRPRAAWVCPACCRETGMVPGKLIPPSSPP